VESVFATYHSLIERIRFSKHRLRCDMRTLLPGQASRIGRHQRAILREDVATTKAAAVRRHRTVLTKQQPAIGAEWAVKPDGVGGNGRGDTVPLPRWLKPSRGRSAAPISVRSVAYAVSAGARSPSTTGVRIHTSNRAGPAAKALRSSTDRVSHGIRSSSTRCFSSNSAGTASALWCSGPPSAVCIQTELVANTPRVWRAVVVRVANDRPWWWRVTW
jgi:hypothetical protein